MHESRKFAIFSTEEIDKIIFSEVGESSPETLRLSVDGSKTFVKWDETDYDIDLFDFTPVQVIDPETEKEITIIPKPPFPPSFIDELSTLEGIYTYDEMIEILRTPEWSEVEEIIQATEDQPEE